jgi:hypothetical protein
VRDASTLLALQEAGAAGLNVSGVSLDAIEMLIASLDVHEACGGKKVSFKVEDARVLLQTYKRLADLRAHRQFSVLLATIEYDLEDRSEDDEYEGEADEREAMYKQLFELLSGVAHRPPMRTELRLVRGGKDGT